MIKHQTSELIDTPVLTFSSCLCRHTAGTSPLVKDRMNVRRVSEVYQHGKAQHVLILACSLSARSLDHIACNKY